MKEAIGISGLSPGDSRRLRPERVATTGGRIRRSKSDHASIRARGNGGKKTSQPGKSNGWATICLRQRKRGKKKNGRIGGIFRGRSRTLDAKNRNRYLRKKEGGMRIPVRQIHGPGTGNKVSTLGGNSKQSKTANQFTKGGGRTGKEVLAGEKGGVCSG